jgi:hypothetical protein
MSSPTVIVTEPDQILQQEIDLAQQSFQPTSRRSLALKLVARTGVTFKDALDLVDEYCDEKAPAVPAYLASEFGVYWLKAVAVANVAIGIFLAWTGVKWFQAHAIAWPWFCGATVFCGLAALSWVKSIERGG